MALALIANVKNAVIQLLNANRGAYASTVGTGNNALGAFPFDLEIHDAIIRADGHVITEGYFKSRLPLRKRFFVASANLVHGERLPEFQGLIGKVEYSLDGVTWLPSVEGEKDDIVGAANVGAAYIGNANAFAGVHFIDDAEGVIYHSSPFCRLEYPSYTRTALLQVNEGHEQAVTATAMSFLAKDRSNAAFDYYEKMSDKLMAMILAGQTKLDPAIVKPMAGGEG